jgi:hypothetical protein
MLSEASPTTQYDAQQLKLSQDAKKTASNIYSKYFGKSSAYTLTVASKEMKDSLKKSIAQVGIPSSCIDQ